MKSPTCPLSNVFTSQFLEPVNMLPYSKRDCADVIRLGILRYKNYSGLLDGTNVITRVLIGRRHEGHSERGDVVMETEVVTAPFEGGRSDHHLRTAVDL